MPADFSQTIIAPSVLAADFSRVGEQVRAVEAAGADWIHLDVMDGRFVDNISFGPAFCAAVKKEVAIPCDVHLMIERPDHYLERFLPVAGNLTIHVEAMGNADGSKTRRKSGASQADSPAPSDADSASADPIAATLARIREASGGTCGAGLSLRPGTPLSAVEPYLDAIDLLLVMTVEPGFGGQPFLPEMLAKIETAAAWRAERGMRFHIQVDGGIRAPQARLCREAGANVFVAGTSVFGQPDMAAAIRALRE